MMRNCNTSNMDGEVQDLEVMTPIVAYSNNFNEDNSNEFWEGDNFNFANGGRSRNRRTRSRAGTALDTIGRNVFGKKTIFNADERARRRERRQARKDTRVQSRGQARSLQAKAQADIARGMGDQSGDIALANALKESPKGAKKGLSTGAIVGIVLGGLAIVGVIAYLVIKKKGVATATATTGTK